MSFGFGAAAQPATGAATGGFGGGFGAAKPATTTTGFGAPASTGFGSTTTAASTGFGNAGAKPGFGATTSTGFGAPANNNTGFGAATTSTGFGAPSTGFGAPSTGFGAPSSGFGAPSTGFGAQTGGFGPTAYSGMAPQQPQQQFTLLPNFQRQSALANYLLELDAAYNALHPKCRFRTFVYNMCGTGQAMDAVQRDRYVAFMNGGGCDDSEYMVAMHANPDPEHLYPAPLHFNQELVQRIARQKEVIQELSTRLEEIMQDVAAVVKVDRDNKQRMRDVRLEGAMLQRRWYALLQKTEVLRHFGMPIEMENLLAHRAETVRHQIAAPGSYLSTLEKLQPSLDEESSRCAATAHASLNDTTASVGTPSGLQRGWSTANRSGSGALVRQLEVEPEIMKDWLQMASNLQNGIDTLEELLKGNLGDMKRIRERIRATAFS